MAPSIHFSASAIRCFRVVTSASKRAFESKCSTSRSSSGRSPDPCRTLRMATSSLRCEAQSANNAIHVTTSPPITTQRAGCWIWAIILDCERLMSSSKLLYRSMEEAPIAETPKHATSRRRAAGVVRPGMFLALIVILAGLSFFFYNFQFVIVSGNSMLPTLHTDQRILVCKALWAIGPPRQGDIVVVDTEDGFIVKRVAYLPGQEVPPEERQFDWPLEPNMMVPN